VGLGALNRRQRRRLTIAAIAVGGGGAAALAIGLLPSGHRFTQAPAANAAPAQRVVQGPTVRVTAATRAAINRALDAFIPAAVARHHPFAAYRFATPSLRRAATPAQWRRGELPVTPFPVRGSRFHGWTVDYAHPSSVGIDLLLRAKPGEAIAMTAYKIDLKRIHGRWLVDLIIPAAMYGAPGSDKPPVFSSKDLGPG
jgi:hypothetical protein